MQRFYDLPSLTSLLAFEAAARHASFKLAAEELNVTPGAISHQIKALEQELGLPLFLRGHRLVTLTSEGEELYSVVARGFSQTASTLRRLKSMKGPEGGVTIAATTAVGSLWLLPRIGAFWRANPGLDVNQRFSDRAADFLAPGIELRIRYGRGSWPEEKAALLFQDSILPVCGRSFFERQHGAGAHPPEAITLEALANSSLIDLEEVQPEWPRWPEWFASLGYEGELPRRLRLLNHSLCLQAAEEGHGLAMGWRKLITPLLDSGRLLHYSAYEIEDKGAFYLTWDSDQPLRKEAQRLRDWLLETVDLSLADLKRSEDFTS